MSGRKIYSAELKLEIVERYLKGDIGIKKLAQEYHVSYGDIQKWRDDYQKMSDATRSFPAFLFLPAMLLHQS